jgi:hypothetical protein
VRGDTQHLIAGMAVAIGLLLGPAEGAAEEYPFLPGERRRSVSLGDTSHGRLIGGVRLEESPALGILPQQRRRNIRYGTEELVALVDHAAHVLLEETGTRLWVGHLSREGGGDIAYSVSHNAGRDADLAFAYVDARGAPVDPHALVRVGRDGRTRRGWRFDPKRTWIAIEAMLRFEGAEVQHLFMAQHLETMVLRVARERGVDPRLRARAAAIIRQPGGGAAAHDDHIHLRIYCSPEDALGGCIDTGRIHPWVKHRPEARRQRARELARLASANDPELRARAVARLSLLGAEQESAAVIAALDDRHAAVAQAAARALLRLDQDRALWRWFEEQSDTRRASSLIGLGEAPWPGAGRFLARVIADDPTLSVRLAALVASERSGRLEPVGALIDRLDDRDAAMRGAARRTLARLTNRSHATSVGWRNAWRNERGRERSAWLWSGFRRSGYAVWGMKPSHAWELVRALGGSDHHAYNAHRVLGELFGQPTVQPAVEWSSAGDARARLCRSWLDRVAAAGEPHAIGPPPAATRRACDALEARLTAR